MSKVLWSMEPSAALGAAQGVVTAQQSSFGSAMCFEGIKAFQEQQPAGLFGVVQLPTASRVLMQHVVDTVERLLKPRGLDCFSVHECH